MARADNRNEDLAAHYIERLSDWAELSKKPLFGAISLRREHLVFAMVWKGDLYFKVDDGSCSAYEEADSQPLAYTRGTGEQHLKSYWQVPADVLDDDDMLQQWAEKAWQAALKSRSG